MKKKTTSAILEELLGVEIEMGKPMRLAWSLAQDVSKRMTRQCGTQLRSSATHVNSPECSKKLEIRLLSDHYFVLLFKDGLTLQSRLTHNSPYISDWPWTLNILLVLTWVLGLQKWTMMLRLGVNFKFTSHATQIWASSSTFLSMFCSLWIFF